MFRGVHSILQAVLFAVLGSGSWLVVSALFNQLVLMLPDFEPSQVPYTFSLMNVAVQASKWPALVYALCKFTVRSLRTERMFNTLKSAVSFLHFASYIRTEPQALSRRRAFHRRHHDNPTGLILERQNRD
jgi:hypothetical protein